MNIIVILKQTFDTEEKISIRNGQINEDGAAYVINPYDEYAIEEAIKLKETHGGEVTVISVGPDRVENALRTALAMGADKAVLVDDKALFGDEHTISRVLAEVIKKNGYDLILGGNASVDNGAGQVGPRLAEELGIAQVTAIIKIEIDGMGAVVHRDAEGDIEIIEAALPILATAQQGLNEPRYPSLPGIMKAKRKPLERITVADLGIDPADIKPKSEVIDQYLPSKKAAGRVLQGELADQAKELVSLLRNEAKVI